MKKARLLITVNGGIIQHIAASQDVEVVIVDHDNLKNDTEEAVKELGNVLEPDLIMSKWDMETSISVIKKQYSEEFKLKMGTKLLGYQVVNENNELHPKMNGSFCVYSSEQARKMIDDQNMYNKWRLLPIYEGDIEDPTIMY